MNAQANFALYSVFELMRDDRERLADLKPRLSTIFQEIGDFLLGTSRELDSFRGIIGPYMEYFYPAGAAPANDAGSFVADVVLPSRRTMDEAIDKAVRIMQNDAAINDAVAGAIEQSLAIRDKIDTMIDLIETIEIYADNARLVSIKAGAEGQTLARISEEMSALSGVANGLSGDSRALIGKMDEAYTRFRKIRERIDILNENYLTQMKLKCRIVFGDLQRDLDALSGAARGMMDYSADIERSIGSSLGCLQVEDLIRQDIERIIALVEESCALERDEDAGDSYRPIVLAVMRDRMNGVFSNADMLVMETHDCCARMKDILNRFIGSIGTDDALGDGSEARFGHVYGRLERIRDEFVGYIVEIIERKKTLYAVAAEILEIMDGFGTSLQGMTSVIRRFEIINMLTKIELAKNFELRKTLATSLTDVADLPGKMKRIVGDTSGVYAALRENMRASIEEYRVNYERQKDVLGESIEIIRKISVKLYESQKYYQDITREIGGTCTRIIAFMETHEREMSRLDEMNALLRAIRDKLASSCDGCAPTGAGEMAGAAALASERLEASFGDGARGMVFSALLREYAAQQNEGAVLLF